MDKKQDINLLFSNIIILGDLAVELRQNDYRLIDTVLNIDTLSNNDITAQLTLENFFTENTGKVEILCYSDNNGIEGPVETFNIPISLSIEKHPSIKQFSFTSHYILDNSLPSEISIYNTAGRLLLNRMLEKNETYRLYAK